MRHAQIVDRGAHLHAEAGALEPEPEADDQARAAQDQKAAITRKAAKAEIELAAEPARRMHRLLQGAPDVSRGGDRHKDEPHRQQHLVELVPAIKPAIEQAFEDQAAERSREKRGDQRQSERHAHAAHEARQHITAKHRKDAMRQIDKAHHAHRYRQADRDQVQHHRKGQAVKPDADKRGEGVAHALAERCLSPRPSLRTRGEGGLCTTRAKLPTTRC